MRVKDWRRAPRAHGMTSSTRSTVSPASGALVGAPWWHVVALRDSIAAGLSEPAHDYPEMPIQALRQRSTTVVTLGLFDRSGSSCILEVIRITMTQRGRTLRARTAETAAAHGACHVPLTDDPAGRTPDIYGRGGLHLNRRDHAITAALTIRTMAELRTKRRQAITRGRGRTDIGVSALSGPEPSRATEPVGRRRAHSANSSHGCINFRKGSLRCVRCLLASISSPCARPRVEQVGQHRAQGNSSALTVSSSSSWMTPSRHSRSGRPTRKTWIPVAGNPVVVLSFNGSRGHPCSSKRDILVRIAANVRRPRART